jgi:hypothetical protein
MAVVAKSPSFKETGQNVYKYGLSKSRKTIYGLTRTCIMISNVNNFMENCPNVCQNLRTEELAGCCLMPLWQPWAKYMTSLFVSRRKTTTG